MPQNAPSPPMDDSLRTLRADVLIAERYRLIAKLGRGAMGDVWRAQDEKVQLPVALKFLPNAVFSDASAMEALKGQARSAAELAHPNILRIHDLIQDAAHRLACIAMELANGGDLDRLRSEQPNGWFEPQQIHGWLDELCTALTYAHEVAGVVHRDLKPANLLLDETGRLKVADFGFSIRTSVSISQVSRVRWAGTLAFASPQQMRGEKPTPADDLYALGATIYCLLTGRPPFFDGDILHQLLKTKAPRMTSLRAECEYPVPVVPEGWERLVAELLAKNPAKRPQSARIVAQRLAELRRPVVPRLTEGRSPRKRRERHPSGRNRQLRLGLVAGAAVVAGLLLWSAGHRPRPASAASGVVARSESDKTDVAAPTPEPAPEPSAKGAASPLPAAEPKRTSSAGTGTLVSEPARAEIDAVAAPSSRPPGASGVEPAPPQVPTGSEYDRLIAEARDLRDSGEMEGAIYKLRQAIAREPLKPEAIAELALLHESTNHPDLAAEQWRRVLEFGPSAGTYYIAAESRIKMVMAQVLAASQVSRPAPAPPPPPSTPVPQAIQAPAIAADIQAAPPSASAATRAPQPPAASVAGPASLAPLAPPEPEDEAPPDQPVSQMHPEAVLGVGLIEREDSLDSNGRRVTLRIQVKAKRGATINIGDVDISVLLFDELGEARVVKTDADVSYRFADPPVDWRGDHDETIEVSYDRSNVPPSKARRRFFGYIVRVYYRGALQDANAEPGLLAVKYPHPERFASEAQGSPKTESPSASTRAKRRSKGR